MREENREQSPELEDAGSQSGGRTRTRRGRSPKVSSDDDNFMPPASSTMIMSLPASRGRASRTRSKSRTASTKPAKSQRSKSRKSSRSRQRAASKKPAADRSRSRSGSTDRKPAARGRGRK